jgi:photosystem II stability/assembly factor-like uncharacterized protein
MRSWKLSSFLISIAILLVASCSGDDAQAPDLQSAFKSGSPGKPGWHWSNPQPQGNDLVDVSFFDEHVGFAVGAKGTIVGSTDGGETWTLQESGVAGLISGVAVTGAMTAVAVGEAGTVVRTINRGATWKRQQNGSTAHLTDVDFGDARHGIAVGQGVVLRTSDGGSTWTPYDCNCYFESVDMIDASDAFAVGGEQILATTDGGATWSVRATFPQQLHDVFFSDVTHGTAVGNRGLILRTTDGGVSWTPQQSGTDAFLWAVSFSDAANGIAVGQPSFLGGALLRTTDGGEHWMQDDAGAVPDFVEPPYRGVAMLNASTGIAVAEAGNILRTTDGGAAWANMTHGAAGYLSGASFDDENNGIAVGDGEMMRSTDAGRTWSRQDVGRIRLARVAHAGAGAALAVGEDLEAGSLRGVILRSTDGGETWITTHRESYALYGIDFVDASTGVATGLFGTLLRTTDAGATWVHETVPAVRILIDVAMADDIGIAVGTDNAILRSTDGGIHWIDVSPDGLPLGGNLHSVDLSDAEAGMAVGSGGSILRTIDGGETWSQLDVGVDATVHDVVCRDRNSAAILARLESREFCVLVTTDAGAHWEVNHVVAAGGLNGLAIGGKNTVTAVGFNGTIIQARDLFRPN